MTENLKFVPYIPRGFEGPTTDVVDALKRGKAVLVEETDRWVKSTWFENEHPELDIQDPYCNSWRVCAEGAVLIVTVGLHNRELIEAEGDVYCPWNSNVDEPDDMPAVLAEVLDLGQRGIYEAAIEWLREVGETIFRRKNGFRAGHANAHDYNDREFETRDQVIAWFDETIEAAETGVPKS